MNSTQEQIEKFAREYQETPHRITLVPAPYFRTLSLEDWKKVLGVGVDAGYKTTDEIVPTLIGQDGNYLEEDDWYALYDIAGLIYHEEVMVVTQSLVPAFVPTLQPA